MVKTLHILNGDSTLAQFKSTNIIGDTFVWREALCEGPTLTKIATDEFWQTRTAFMTEYFEITEAEFKRDVIAPFSELENTISDYTEIVLWFEYDLFCQINLIAVLSWLKDLNLKAEIGLVCVGEVEGNDRLLGLSEISSSLFPKLLEERVKLNTRELTHAQDVWEIYCSDRPDDLYNFILLKMNEFKYLPDALESHHKRFPYSGTGLNEIEQKILDLYLSGVTEPHKIVGKLLRWQVHYGFGDLQYFNTIDYLKPVLQVVANTKTIPNKSRIETLLNRDYKLGGATAKDWYWDENEEALVPRDTVL